MVNDSTYIINMNALEINGHDDERFNADKCID